MTYEDSPDLSALNLTVQWSSRSRARWFITGFLHACSFLLVVFTSPFSLFFALKRCQEYERAVVLGSTLDTVRVAHLICLSNIQSQAKIRGPGLVFILPFLEKAEIIDIRTKVFEVPSQQILTTDSVTLTVDAVVYYRVFDPVKAATGAMDYNEVIDSQSKNYQKTNITQAVRGLASSTLGGILGTYQLGNLLSERWGII